jgi:GTP-binding protein Era
MKSGVVAIIGRANVGKSTLLNNLVGEKVAIVSPVPQTTRNQIRAILNEKRGQIVFLDTPGMHVSKHALDRAMISAINNSLAGVDVVLHLVDATEHVGEEEAMVIERLSDCRAPIILGLNKIDCAPKHIQDYLDAWQKKIGKDLSNATDRVMPVPLSALTGTNIDRLLDELFARLPEGEPLYPPDILTDFPRQLTIQDIVREKLLAYVREEIPFSLGIYAEEIADRSEKLTYVKALILVERDSQKKIVIGKNGELLKKAGEAARKDMEEIYGKKFYLDLWVKVDEDWKENSEQLKRMGYI